MRDWTKQMIEMRDWTKRVLETVGARGPYPQEYAAVSLACSWVRQHVPDYKAVLREMVIEPHEAWVKTHPEVKPYFNLILHMYHQPRGYAGDGDLLTKLYRTLDSIGDDCQWSFSRWDSFIASKPETLALQSRPEYLSRIAQFAAEKGCVSFLDVACGIGEFTKQVLMEQGDQIRYLVGIDNDPMSIQIARQRNSAGMIEFCEMNVLKELPDDRDDNVFDLIWCAGLFDYLGDEMFVRMGRRLLTLQPKFVIIGNIGQSHPTKEFMSCFNWDLFDRSRFDLLELGERVTEGKAYEVCVDTDRTGLQHFLRIRMHK
jgi:SAM-dependent methyltransferase